MMSQNLFDGILFMVFIPHTIMIMRMIMIMIKKTILMMMRRPDIADEKDDDEDEVFDAEMEDDGD